MKRLLLIVLLLFGCGQAQAQYEWTATDTALQLTFSTLWIMDWNQTLHIARNAADYYEKESAQFIGKHPSKRDVNIHFATGLIGHAAVSYLLPKPYRSYWQTVYIIYEYDIVQNNRDIGLGISAHF